MPVITSPRPPLNLFNVARMNVSSTWTTLLDTPTYQIPAAGPTPARTVEAVALLTSLVVSNNTSGAVQLSVRVLDGANNTWVLLNEMSIPPNDFALVDLGKQNLPSNDRLQLKVNTSQSAVASLSYVLNQREEFVVIP